MLKNDFYNLLINNNIYSKKDINETKIFENDIVIEDVYFNSNKKFKIETDGMSNEEIIISLLAKQTLYIRTIKNVICFFVIVSIILALLLSIIF